MVSDKLKKQAKQAKVSLTYMRGGKRYNKTEKMLSRQLNKKGGSDEQEKRKNDFIAKYNKEENNKKLQKLLTWINSNMTKKEKDDIITRTSEKEVQEKIDYIKKYFKTDEIILKTEEEHIGGWFVTIGIGLLIVLILHAPLPEGWGNTYTVSYTHLTLPTKALV